MSIATNWMPAFPLLVARSEPFDNRLRRTAVDLHQQSARTGDIDQARVPAIHPPPHTGLRAVLPLGFPAAGLVDTDVPQAMMS